MKTLENKFHEDMTNIYFTAKKELKYNASRFIQLVSTEGGLKAAKQLISKSGGTSGFEILWRKNRLDLTVEALALRTEYYALFTDEEREICKHRLKEFGYEID
jgi:phenylacetate-coenzyme A ligase PaaK-like adenylate-forming protein